MAQGDLTTHPTSYLVDRRTLAILPCMDDGFERYPPVVFRHAPKIACDKPHKVIVQKRECNYKGHSDWREG